MLSQSSWVGSNRRYDAPPSRSRRNAPFPQQPAYVRLPRRRAVPGPTRNPINSYRICTPASISSPANVVKKTISRSSLDNAKPNYINSLKITKLTSRKKSLSMVDLSPINLKSDVNDSCRSETTSSLHTQFHAVELSNAGCDLETTDTQSALSNALDPGAAGARIGGFPPDTNKAASLVCRALVVNAWRRRREDNSQLQETIRKLTQQVDHLHIQIVVLRRLLDTENGRVSRFMAEMRFVRAQSDDIGRDRDALKAEKEEAVKKAEQLREEASEKTVVTENLRNELFTTKSQLSALDEQMSRDREKLLKLREDKKILLDKVVANEALASQHLTRAERAEAGVRDLEKRLSVQTALLNRAQDYQRKSSQEVKLTTEEMTKVRNQLKATRKVVESLSSRTNNLENELCGRDAALRRFESAYNTQLSETAGLRERLERQSQEGGWSSRMLQIAGTVVRAPRSVIFRTLSFLSHPTGSSVTS